MKKIGALIISLAIGLLLIVLVYNKIGIGNIFLQIKILAWWQIAILFLLYFANVFIWIIRWKIILTAMGHKNLPFKLLSQARIGESALSYVMPGMYYGGEVIRMVALKKSNNVSVSQATISIIIDRVMETAGLGVFLFLGIFCLIFKHQFVWASFFIVSLLVILFLFLLAFKLVGLRKIMSFFAKIFGLRKIRRYNLKGKWISLADRVESIGQEVMTFFKKSPKIVYQGLILTCITWILNILQLVFFVYFSGKSISLIAALPMFIIITFFVSLIPIPADLGVYEGTSTLIFKNFGFNGALGLSFSLVSRFINFFLVAIGFFFIIHYFTKSIFNLSKELSNDDNN